MKKGSFVYIDMIRLVSPDKCLPADIYDFCLFGIFDAMKVYTKGDDGKPVRSIKALLELHRKRYVHIPEMFDRQPLYLYSGEEDAGKAVNDASKDIFGIGGTMSTRPLVLTLFQLQDSKLECIDPKYPEKSEADNLLDEFTAQIKSLIPEGKQVEFRVFYCLGEADVAVVFRGSEIATIGEIIYRMRIWDKREGGVRIRVLSNSSYCAFPKAAEGILEKNLKKWLDNEPDSTSFYTFTKTSFGMNNNSGRADRKYLLGEWDYCREWNNEGDGYKSFTEGVKKFTSAGISKRKQRFRFSYTIPGVELTKESEKYDCSDHSVKELYVKNEIEFTSTAYDNLKNMILGYDLKKVLNERISGNYADEIQLLFGTLKGLHNHLERLKYGCFEEDLFAFVEPVFQTLKETTGNCTRLLNRYNRTLQKLDLVADEKSAKAKKTIIQNMRRLLDSYIENLSELLSELQHMFSILSVSPYTYLETYGSNMRSIAAVCKLLIAYQGIACLLAELYKTGEGKAAVKKTFLILPYRNKLSNTREYFTEAGPRNTICRIHIDFTKMFHIRHTLFILLHECGHQLVDSEFRSDRIKFYAKAVMSAVLDRNMVFYYTHIGKAIGCRKDLSENEAFWEKEPEYMFSDENITACKEDVKSHFYGMRDLYAELIEKTIWPQYKIDNKKYYEPHAIEAGLFFHVKDAVQYSFENELVPRLFEELTKKVYEEYKELIAKEFSRTDTECNKWLLAALKTDYSNGECYSQKIKSARESFKKLCGQGETIRAVCEELKDLFGEIYSDVFAYEILGIGEEKPEKRKEDFEEYLEMLIFNCGYEADRIMCEKRMILRLLAVYGLIFGDPKDDEAIVEYFYGIMGKYLSKSQTEVFCSKTQKFLHSMVYEPVIDYRRLCEETIRQHIREKQEGGNCEKTMLKDGIGRIKELYNAAEDNKAYETVNHIHYFWKTSTQRENSEDEKSKQKTRRKKRI